MNNDDLFEIWQNRNPKFETKLQDLLLEKFTDYGKGASAFTEAKGKAFGGGYELYIYAFFIGLYQNKRRVLENETKNFGHIIKKWGNVGDKIGRTDYSIIRTYIFMALVARAKSINWIDLEQNKITVQEVVKDLIIIMEEYTNYGFYCMLDKMNQNTNYFFHNRKFLDYILEVTTANNEDDDSSDDEQLAIQH